MGLAPFPSLSLCIALKLGRLDMGLAPFPSLSLCIALKLGRLDMGLAPFPSLSLCIALKLGRLDMGLAPFPSLSLCIALKMGRLDMGSVRLNLLLCTMQVTSSMWPAAASMMYTLFDANIYFSKRKMKISDQHAIHEAYMCETKLSMKYTCVKPNYL